MTALLKALKISDGDEVIVQAFTCVAVAEGVMALGAKPVYVDIEAFGYNICVDDLKRKITKKTRAIVVQHTFGIPAAMKAIISIAESAHLFVIEDCCHTIGSSQDGRVVGSWGIGSFYSFEWGKPLAAGLGGVATVNTEDMKRRLDKQLIEYKRPPKIKSVKIQIQYIAHQMLYRPRLYWVIRDIYKTLGKFGVAEGNYHSIQKSVVSEEFSWRMLPSVEMRAVSKLKNIRHIEDYARKVSKIYRDEILNKNVTHPVISIDCNPVFARYPLRVRNKEDVLKMARKENVELADWYSSPVHPLSKGDLIKVGYVFQSCRQAEERCKEVVTLPTHQKTKKKDIIRAIKFINSL